MKSEKFKNILMYSFLLLSIEDNAPFKLGGEACTLFVYIFVSIASSKLGGVVFVW